jgi:hypothetical protein
MIVIYVNTNTRCPWHWISERLKQTTFHGSKRKTGTEYIEIRQVTNLSGKAGSNAVQVSEYRDRLHEGMVWSICHHDRNNNEETINNTDRCHQYKKHTLCNSMEDGNRSTPSWNMVLTPTLSSVFLIPARTDSMPVNAVRGAFHYPASWPTDVAYSSLSCFYLSHLLLFSCPLSFLPTCLPACPPARPPARPLTIPRTKSSKRTSIHPATHPLSYI